ncbi:MAG: winged helix-turn-helix transcriptional regulator [Chloracidobacterium sp.]|nr:winged helix-turn-helix transcriptional regulator [Chloracidobacterium sp.]
MPGDSQKVLTKQLRELMTTESFSEKPTGAIPSPIEYSLTWINRSLLIALAKIIRLCSRAIWSGAISTRSRR